MSKKRRNFSAQFKLETVLDGLRDEKTVAQICRERDITESLYYRIAELERLAGKEALGIAILKTYIEVGDVQCGRH